MNTDIAGIELVSCVFHCYSTSCLVLTLYCNAYVVSAVMNETVRSPHGLYTYVLLPVETVSLVKKAFTPLLHYCCCRKQEWMAVEMVPGKESSTLVVEMGMRCSLYSAN